MPAIPFHHYPLAPNDTPWSAADEVAKATPDDLKIMCAWVEAGQEDKKQGYKLPHHLADSHKTVRAAVIAAGNVLMGARGGVHGIPKDELDGVKSHLEKHYHEFGMKAPWEAKSDDRVYTTKMNGGIVKDVDSVQGIVTGYFASFNTLDSDGDVFDPSAFNKTVKENASRIMHLLQHNTMMPLARPELTIDSTGLFFKSKISKTKYGDDTIQLYLDGVYKEHSVGFEELASKSDTIDDDVVNRIMEVRLWEGSTVTWGANPNTPVESVKNLPLEDRILYVKERTGLLQKALHRGTLHDDTYNLLEIELKQWDAYLALTPPQGTEAAATSENDLLQKMLYKTNQLKQLF